MGGYSYGEDSLFEAIDSHARVGARIFVPKKEVAWIIYNRYLPLTQLLEVGIGAWTNSPGRFLPCRLDHILMMISIITEHYVQNGD